MATMTIKNTSGVNAFFGYGDASVESTASFGTSGIEPAFYLAAGASKAGLPYSLAAGYQFQKDLNAGLIEVTVGSPLITLRNSAAVDAYFGYLPPTQFVATGAETGLMSQDSGLPGVKGLAYEINTANGISPLNADITAGRTTLDGVIITVSAVTNGTVSPAAGAHAISAGADFVLTMTPATGYHIGAVLDNSVSQAITSPYTIHSAVADHTVAVTFTINTYAVTYNLGTGTRTGGGALAQTINYGLLASVPTYTAASGYRIADVPWSPVQGPITAITAYTALYTKTWAVTFDLGTGTRTGGGALSQTVDNATAASAPTYTAAAGYRIADVPWDTAFVSITADTTVTALYTRFWIVAASAGANGSVSPTTQNVDNAASSAAITATPDLHYHFVAWSGDYVGATNPYTFTNVTAAKSITAAFAIDTYTLTYTAGANGSITGTTPQTVNWGVSGSVVSATADAHYHFEAWSDAYPTDVRQDMGVIADVTVSASFAIDTYTLTYSAGAGGTVVGTTPQTVNWNASGSEVTATPDVNYRFRQWSDAVMTAARTDAAVSADVTVSASFIRQWTMTMAKGTGTGDITPVAGTSLVDQSVANDITATATNFVNWTATGGAVIGNDTSPTTTVTLTADSTVTANWSA